MGVYVTIGGCYLLHLGSSQHRAFQAVRLLRYIPFPVFCKSQLLCTLYQLQALSACGDVGRYCSQYLTEYMTPAPVYSVRVARSRN